MTHRDALGHVCECPHGHSGHACHHHKKRRRNPVWKADGGWWVGFKEGAGPRNPRILRNLEAFTDSGGVVHPIRASQGYSMQIERTQKRTSRVGRHQGGPRGIRRRGSSIPAQGKRAASRPGERAALRRRLGVGRSLEAVARQRQGGSARTWKRGARLTKREMEAFFR